LHKETGVNEGAGTKPEGPAGLARLRARLAASLGRNRQITFALIAVAIGIAAAYGAIAFRYVIAGVQWGALGTADEQLLDTLAGAPWWQIVLAPTLGGLAIGLFVRFVMPERRPLAVADVIEATAVKGARMSIGSGAGAALTSAASIGVGASVGREGPVVHLGASLAAYAGERLNLSRSRRLTLLGCGVASAVAASFNAPIAGVLFALEVVVGHYALSAFAPIVMASVAGTVISRIHYGDFPAFTVPQHLVVSVWEFGVFALLGLASAAAALTFMRSTFEMESLAEKVPVPDWVKPAMAGLVIGGIAILFPQILGVGYGITDQAIKGGLGIELLIALFLVKIFSTALCLGFGFGGGVFSPSLVVGAMLGGIFGTVTNMLAAVPTSSPGVYSMVGMGAVAGAVLGAPISTILIVFELTGDYKVTIAVMVGVAIASVIVQQFGGKSFFTRQLARRGIDLTGAREREALREIPVRRLMQTEMRKVTPGVSLAELRRRIVRAPHGVLFVADSEDTLLGIITMRQLGEVLFEGETDEALTAADLAQPPHAVVRADMALDAAFEVFTEAGTDELVPVLGPGESKTLVGVLVERDVILAHERALLELRAEERGEA
jgi:CIC family chloride channel protein